MANAVDVVRGRRLLGAMQGNWKVLDRGARRLRGAWSDWRISALALTSLSVLCGVYAFSSLQYPAQDDSYIVARLVRQLIEGNGWAFNVGERWNVATSPFHVLVSLPLAFAGLESIVAVRMSSLIVLIVGVAALSIQLDRKGLTGAALFLPIVMMALAPLRLTTGLETQLYVGLLLIFLAGEIARRNTWPIVAVLVLARPDGVFVLAWKLIADWGKSRLSVLKGLGIVLALLGPWVAFSMAYFGSPLPDSVSNKALQADSGIWDGYGTHLIEHLGRAFGVMWPLVLGLAVAGVYFAAKRWGLGAVGPAAAVVAQSALYVLRRAPEYDWYYAPLLSVVALYALLGIMGIAALLSGASKTLAILGVAVLSTLIVLRPIDLTYSQDSRNAYRAVAAHVNAGSARTVASAEVGALGHAVPNDVRIYDLIGLVSPNPPVLAESGVDAFFRELPDVVVIHDEFPRTSAIEAWVHETPLLRDPRFGDSYVQTASFPSHYGQLALVFEKSTSAIK